MSELRSVRGAKPTALVVVAAVVAVWVLFLDAPFVRVPGFTDWIGNMGARISHNYVRYGVAATKGGQILNLEETAPADRSVYHGHPATMLLVNAGVMAVTGSTGPWTTRLVPLLASILALALLALLLARDGRDPWLPVAIMAAMPLFGAHATSLVFESVVLAWMLAVLLLWQRRRLTSVIAMVGIGGLIDYPVLYLGPWLALVMLFDRDRSRAERWRFVVALGCVSVASLAVSLIHNAWASGSGDWLGKILDSFAAKGELPGAGSFTESQLRYATDSFTLAGVLLAVVGAVLLRARLGSAAGAFAFVGVLHVAAFRGHAQIHEFWLWYLLPVCAIAVGSLLARLPDLPRWLLFGAVVGFGWYGSVSLWLERDRAGVREVAADLTRLFDENVVLHKLRGPPGWAMEPFRGRAILEGDDFLNQAKAGTAQRFLDTVAGTFGYLDRPQLAFALESDLREGELDFADRAFPGSRIEPRGGEAGRYLVWDIQRFLLDPSRSPVLLDWMKKEECARLSSRAHMFLVLGALEPGSKLLWVDGRDGPVELFRGRTVKHAAGAAVSEWKASAGWDAAAWPDTDWGRQLTARPGVERLRLKSVAVRVPLLRATR